MPKEVKPVNDADLRALKDCIIALVEKTDDERILRKLYRYANDLFVADIPQGK